MGKVRIEVLAWSLFVMFLGVNLILGCRLGGNYGAGEVGPQTGGQGESDGQTGGSASLQVVISLPSPGTQGVSATRAPAVLADETASPSVAFGITLLDSSKTDNPATRVSKTIQVDAKGQASATFSGFPVFPVLVRAIVSGGKIGSFTDFQGALDLKNGTNTIVLEPTGLRSRGDVLAVVIDRLSASGTLLALAPVPLVAGVASLVSGIDLAQPAVYDIAFAHVANAISNGTAFTPDVSLLIGAPTGTDIARLLCVNSGPTPVGEEGNADVTTRYQQIGVEEIRIHDYYGPLDMATIYRDHSADPASASSYDFSVSDQYYRKIVDGGFKVYFRIGDSYNPGAGYPVPAQRRPTNYVNYIKAAIEVVRHYDDPARWGRRPIDKVEIWNEPDFIQFWDGSVIEFINFFASSAVALKAAFPNLEIGGPGFTQNAANTSSGRAQLEAFLGEISRRSVPLDFFSWHMYSNDPAQFASAAAFFRSRLDAYGYTATAIHNTEYHTDTYGVDDVEALKLRAMGKGAALVTATWIEFQKAGMAQACFFRGNDTNINVPSFYGLCYADGKLKKTGDAFGLWSVMCDYPKRLELVASSSGVASFSVLAGSRSDGGMALLVANFGKTPRTWSPTVASGSDLLGGFSITLRTVSDTSSGIQTPVVSLPITSPEYSVQLLTLANK